MRSVLRRRDYRLLLTAFGISRSGDFLYVVALVVYVYDKTGSSAWVSVATLLRLLPYAVLSPIAGVLADRYERRTVMVCSNLIQFAIMVAITVTAGLSGPAAVVIGLCTLNTVAATVYLPSVSGMTRISVPEDELAAANSLLSTVDALALIAGPAAGGLLLLFGSPAVAFGIDAGTFVVSAACLARVSLRSRPEASAQTPNMLRELKDGGSALIHNRTICVLVGCLVAGTVIYGVELVVLVLVSKQRLGTGTAGLGLLTTAIGVGGLAGAALSSRLAANARPRATIAALVLLTGLPMASLALIDSAALAFAVLVVEGTAAVALDVLIETAMQRGVATSVLGRVSALVMSLAVLGTLVGTAVAPTLVNAVGLRSTLVACGLIPVLIATASLVLLPKLDADAERTRVSLAPRVALLRGLGLVEGASMAAVERLAAAVTEEPVTAGTVIVREHDLPDDVFVLTQGTVAVERHNGSSTVRVNELTAPDYFGEIGLIQATNRTATVSATTDCVLWRIPGELFLEVVAPQGRLGSSLAGVLATRLAGTAMG